MSCKGFVVPKKRLELSRPCGHYTLNVARLPIPPLGQSAFKNFNFNMCPEQESNLHPLARTWPSTMRVYHFRHLG